MHLRSATLLQILLRRGSRQPQALDPAPLPQVSHRIQNPTAVDGTQVVQHLKLEAEKKLRLFETLLGLDGETTAIQRFLVAHDPHSEAAASTSPGPIITGPWAQRRTPRTPLSR